MEIIKEPSTTSQAVQVLLIPLLIVILLAQQIISQFGYAGQIIIVHGISIFVIHKSNINIYALPLAQMLGALSFLIITIELLMLPINYFWLALTIEEEFLYFPVKTIALLILLSIEHFPGCRHIIESENMLQIMLLSMAAMEEHLTVIKRKNVNNYKDELLILSIFDFYLSIGLSLFELALLKQRFVISICKTGFEEKCFVVIITMIFISNSYVFVLANKRYFVLSFDSVLKYIIGYDLKTVACYIQIVFLFTCVKVAINLYVQYTENINIYYNPIHKALFTAFSRKSYHFLMLAFYVNSDESMHLFYMVSLLGVELTCYLEILRPYCKLFGFYYKQTKEFVSDRETATAINHIELIVSVALFPALSKTLGINFMEKASFTTTLLSDSFAEIVPVLYLYLLKEQPLRWVDIMEREVVSVPIYQGWSLSVYDADYAFTHDLQLKESEFCKEKLKICKVAVPRQAENNFGNRTPVGTFAYIITQMISMSFSDIQSIWVIIVSFSCGFYESVGYCDNLLSAVIFACFAAGARRYFGGDNE